MRQSEFPEWAQEVKRQHKGTQLRKIGNSIYLYAVSSKRVPDKPYPEITQSYLGIVTEGGLIEAQSFSFRPLETETAPLGSIRSVDVQMFTPEEWAEIEGICLVRSSGAWFFPRLSPRQAAILRRKHLLSPTGTLLL